MVVDNINANQQAVAVIGSNYAITSELNRIDLDQTKKNQRSDRDVSRETRTRVKSTSDIVNAKETRDLGTQIIANLASELASVGIDLTPQKFGRKVEEKVQNEYFGKLGTEDAADIDGTLTDYAVQKNTKQKQNGQNKNNQALLKDPTFQALIKEYSSVYTQYLINGSSELREKLLQLESQLQQKGFSSKDLLQLQLSIKLSIRSGIASQIKNTFFNRILSPEKSLEYVMNDKSMDKVIDFAFGNMRLGGWDFGGYNDHLQGTTDRAIFETGEELKGLVREGLEGKLMEKHMAEKSNNVDKEIKELLKLGLKVGFDVKGFVESWQTQKVDLGLVVMNVPVDNRSGQGADSERRQRNGYEYSRDDEKELLINQLRALFMKRAVTGDMFTVLQTSVRVRKLKNGLIKLGLTFDDFKNVEKEGRAAARVITLQMLKDTFVERATLYELSGPAFHLIERQIKGLVSNLERLGISLSKCEMDLLRDNANRLMYETTHYEMTALMAATETNPNPSIEQKIKLMAKLLMRIREESGFQSELGEDVEQLIAHHDAQLEAVKESA